MKSRKNSFKRVAASALAVLTVAAYAAPVANVGGLPGAKILSAKATEAGDLTEQAGNGVIKVDQAKDYIEGIYEVTVDETTNELSYTKVEIANNDTFVFAAEKKYVIRTTAYVEEDGVLVLVENDALAEGIYEYTIGNLQAQESFDVILKTCVVSTDEFEDDTEIESIVVKQNGKTVTIEEGNQGYEIVEGAPFTFTAVPSAENAGMMLAITNGTIKGQTKDKLTGAITATAVLDDDADEAQDDTVVSWTEYLPILELTNENGVVKATDVNFNNKFENAVVGSIDLRYGYFNGATQFVNNETNEAGAYIRSNDQSQINPEFKPQYVRIKGVDYTFVKQDNADITVEEYKKVDNEYKWVKIEEDAFAATNFAGKYRVTLGITATTEATIPGETFAVTQEFEVVNPQNSDVTPAFYAITDEEVPQLIEPENGVYVVDWNGEDEITVDIGVTANVAGVPTELFEGEDFWFAGTTTATDEGTYTVTIAFDPELGFDNYTITWKVVNTNKYVEAKEEIALFDIRYRQANAESLRAYIAKQLNIVGTDADALVIKYYDADEFNEAPAPEELDGSPADNAGDYVALVSNAVDKDGNNIMKKNGEDVDPVRIDFTVGKSNITIEPAVDALDITYGDVITPDQLYKIFDNYTDIDGKEVKEEVDLPINNFITVAIMQGNEEKQPVDGEYFLDAGDYEYTVNLNGAGVVASNDYQLNAPEDAIEFTVNKRDINDINFGKVEKDKDPFFVTVIDKETLAAADDEFDNPADVTEGDILYAGGTVTAFNSEMGKVFTVKLRGTGNNFDGVTEVEWIIKGGAINPAAISYEAVFDVAKPRINATIDINKIDGEIAKCGFYYANNDKMTAFADGIVVNNPEDEANKANAIKEELLKADADANPNNAKKVTFGADAIAQAKVGDGILTAAIANSSVYKNVYAVPFVEYTNGEIAYGELDVNNYYQLVLEAENALVVTKTDKVVNNKTRVEINAKRVDKQGYEVLAYGILYNNSDAWRDDTFATECANYSTWLDVRYLSTEKKVKEASLNETDLANNMLGVQADVINTADEAGIGAKKLYARAYVTIKDGSNDHNIKTYYSNLVDCTYGAYVAAAEDADYLYVNEVDQNNKTQVEFYNAEGKLMKASSGSELLNKDLFNINIDEPVEP